MANPRVIRTFSIVGADGAGKTALVEALLRVADAKRASPEGSNSRLDAEPEEVCLPARRSHRRVQLGTRQDE